MTGISEFWRKNTSPNEAVELANVLRALRKVAGHLGRNVGVIEYAGMSQRQGAGIVLDPELVADGNTVPPQDEGPFRLVEVGIYDASFHEHVYLVFGPGRMTQHRPETRVVP